MPLFAFLLLVAGLIGWNVAPARKALLATVGLGFGLSALLAITWTIWNEPFEDFMWWLWQSLVITGLMLVAAAIAGWLRSGRDGRVPTA